MGKVILVCGKICSGKSYYSNQLKEQLNAVVITPDEATYELINIARWSYLWINK